MTTPLPTANTDETLSGPEAYDRRRMNAETVEVPVLTEDQIIAMVGRSRRRADKIR